jgi:heme/copper-type cytochrome/quinol oxidase subunit 1
VILAVCLRALHRAWRDGALTRGDWRNPRLVGFLASAALTLSGFLIGSAIRNSNTMIPAHYHASIGAVTVGYMAITYLLLKPLGFPALSERLGRLIPWQLACFGFGQVIFVLGFGFGGFHGLSRKAYAVEQHIQSFAELAGIGVMAIGGIIAVAGGILFLVLTVWAGCPRVSTDWPLLKLKHSATHERA